MFNQLLTLDFFHFLALLITSEFVCISGSQKDEKINEKQYKWKVYTKIN